MKLPFLSVFVLLLYSLFAQQGDGGIPVSAKFVFEPEIPQISFPQPNIDELIAEDEQRDGKGLAPWRFGYINECELNTQNSGAWFDLPNGGKLWMLEVHCEQALTVNIALQNSNIPSGNELYVYHPNHEFILGKFTQRHLVNGALGVELIQGSRAVVEYYVAPENVDDLGRIEISSVTHGYRTAADFTRAFGDSGSCNMNVNCPDGLIHQNQRNAAVMLVSGQNGFCSGALINNTNNDGKPYVLTARHCGNSGFENWIYRFNWQALGCENPTNSPEFQSLSGSVNRAGSLNNTFDMRLVEITGGLENGTVPASYNPFFAGWDNSGNVPSSTFCIHHPSGDIKKIAFDDDAAVSTQDMGSTVENSVWEVVWDRNTTTEPGSSGSPLFDNMGRIIGQLWGGGASCTNLSAPDYYGKVSMSWNPPNSPIDQQLKHWLDPDDTGVALINGFPESEPMELDVAISQGSNWELSGVICGTTVTPVVNLINLGSETVNSVVISYTYNPGTSEEYVWTGSLSFGQMTSITLPEQTLPDGDYTFHATIVSVNGENDENENNNQLNTSFTIIDNGFEVDLNLTLDCYGNETTWRLLTGDEAQVVASGGPYGTSFFSQVTVNQSWCLAEACYVFEINDSDGDGFSGGGWCQFTGSLQITEGSEILNQITPAQANFGSQRKLPFCLGDAVSDLEKFDLNTFEVSLYPNPTDGFVQLDFSSLGAKDIRVYSAQGRLITSSSTHETQWNFDASGLAQGVYFVQVQFGALTEYLKFIKN